MENSSDKSIFTSILSLYREAVKKLPVLKYSWGVIVIICILALITYLKIGNPEALVKGSLYVIGIMFLIFLFSLMVKTNDKAIKYPLYILIYSIILTVTAFVVGFGIHSLTEHKFDVYYKLFGYPSKPANFDDKKINVDTLPNKKLPEVSPPVVTQTAPIHDTIIVDKKAEVKQLPVTTQTPVIIEKESNIFIGRGADKSVPFGGSPYCNYTGTMSNTKIVLTKSINSTAVLSYTYSHSTDENCFTADNRRESFTYNSKDVIINTDLIQIIFQAKDEVHVSAVFNGIISKNQVSGTLVIKHLNPELDVLFRPRWTIPIVLKQQ